MPVKTLEKSSRRPQPGRSCLKVDGNVPRQVQVRFDKVVKVKHHSVPNDVRMIPSKWRSKRTDKVRVAWAWSRSFRAKTWKDNAVALCSACVLETEVMNELGVVCRCPARWPIVWHNSGAYIFTPSPDDPTSLKKCSPVKHSLIDAVALVCRRAKSFVHLGLVPVNVIGDRIFWKDGAFVDREPVQIAAPASVPDEKSVEVVIRCQRMLCRLCRGVHVGYLGYVSLATILVCLECVGLWSYHFREICHVDICVKLSTV